MWNYTINLQNPLKLLKAQEPLFTGDKAAHTLSLTITDGASPFPLEGYTLRGYFLRSDGDTVFLTGSTASNTATLTLPESCYAVSGAFTLVVKAASKDQVRTLLAVSGNVLDSTTDSVIDPENAIPSLSDLLAQIDKMEQASARASAAAESAETIAQSVSDKLNRGELNGRGLTILGYYDTLEALTASVTALSAGDCYGIGAAAPYDLYVYDGVDGIWRSNGSLSGIPAGGSKGQVLTKASDTAEDTAWANPPVTSVNGSTGDVVLELSKPKLEEHAASSFGWWMEPDTWTPLMKYTMTESGIYLIVFRMALVQAVSSQMLAGIGLKDVYTAKQSVVTGIAGAQTTVVGAFQVTAGDEICCSICGDTAGTYTLSEAWVSLVKLG